MSRPHPALARYLAAAYILLVIYASLHPFTGWQARGVPLLDFLGAPWPRYYTGFDLAANVLAYLPLGFLVVAAFQQRLGIGWPALLALLTGAGLSLGLETAQNFLPSRVPSNVDLGCNVLGTALGTGAGMLWGRELIDGGRLHRLRTRWIAPGRSADFGLVLLGLWLLAQLNPEPLLFASGDLRQLFELPPLAYSPRRFVRIEAGIAACGLLVAGLILWRLLRRPDRRLLITLLLLPLVVKAFANAVLVQSAQLGQWLTPGNAVGMACGALMLLALTGLAPLVQRMAAALALMLATALVNLAPENPYLTASMAVWQQGHFLNFNGLTRLVAILWPFAALPYLMLPRGRPGDGG